MTLAALLFALQAALPMTTVAQGSSSQILQPREVVLRDAEAWAALWRAHSAVATPPAPIDFSRYMLVGIFLGTRPSAGYAVDITAVSSRDGTTTVDYRERQPGPGVIAAQVLTSPFHVVRIPATDQRVVFRQVP
jgi:hypothetical protein